MTVPGGDQRNHRDHSRPGKSRRGGLPLPDRGRTDCSPTSSSWSTIRDQCPSRRSGHRRSDDQASRLQRSDHCDRGRSTRRPLSARRIDRRRPEHWGDLAVRDQRRLVSRRADPPGCPSARVEWTARTVRLQTAGLRPANEFAHLHDHSTRLGRRAGFGHSRDPRHAFPAIEVAHGFSAIIPVKVVRANGSDGALTIASLALPPGLTVAVATIAGQDGGRDRHGQRRSRRRVG